MQPSETTTHPLQQWQEALWLLIVLLTPLFVNSWVEQQFEASKVWLLRTLVWVLAVVWLAGRMAGIRPKPLPPPIRNLLIALVLVLCLSTFLSTNHYIALFGTLERANGLLTQLSYLLLFVCIATRIDAQRSRRLLHVIVLTALPICLLGLVQAAGWQPLPVFTDARSPITSTLGRANFTGAYLALVLPLTLTAVPAATGRWQRTGYGTLVVLELLVLVLTRARAAWIAAAFGGCVLLWLRVTRQRSWQVRWFSALGGVVVLGGVLLLILQRGIADGGSIAARWAIWRASLRLLWPRLWLGYGADTLELYFPSVYPPQLVYYQGRGVVVDRAHNWLLDWSLSFGVVATAVLVAFVYFVLRQGRRQLSVAEGVPAPGSDDQPLEPCWVAACMAALCAQLAGNLFLFEVAATGLLFWLLLGLVTAAALGSETETAPAPAPLRMGNVVIVVCVLIVGWAVWQGNARPLLADIHSRRGTRALNLGNIATASAEYASAVERQPRRSAYHVAVALTAARQGNFAQAEEALQRAIALRPTDPVLYTQLAAVYAHAANETAEKTRMAYGAYEHAISLAPTIALTYQQYADLALRSGDEATALKQARRAVDLDATDGVAYGILGWVYLRTDNHVAAQNAFDQAVKWQPDSADFHLGLATAFFRQGDFPAAHEALQRSLLLDPTYGPSLTLQVQLQQ